MQDSQNSGFTFNAEYQKFEKFVDVKVIRVNEELTTTKKDGTPLAGKPYYLATIEYNGQRCGAVVYETNLPNINEGAIVSASVSFTQDQPTPWISLLGGAPRATAEMFNFDFESALEAVGVGALQTS